MQENNMFPTISFDFPMISYDFLWFPRDFLWFPHIPHFSPPQQQKKCHRVEFKQHFPEPVRTLNTNQTPPPAPPPCTRSGWSCSLSGWSRSLSGLLVSSFFQAHRGGISVGNPENPASELPGGVISLGVLSSFSRVGSATHHLRKAMSDYPVLLGTSKAKA